ncbi:MAG: flagellar basal body-associated FliL family protein [Treponema sp.]|nr:flagellar basal body-associated FliL family protein [Treponema sp.]
MSDDLDLSDDSGDAPSGGGSKKASGLAALLPNLLKFVAIGLGAIIFIVTVSVITFNILNRGGRSQTIIPSNNPFVGAQPLYTYFSLIGPIRTTTRDPIPHSVVVDIQIGYDLDSNAAATELIARLPELQDFVRVYFRSKRAEELGPENEARLKQEIMEQLNTRVLSTARARRIIFRQLDVMQMQ